MSTPLKAISPVDGRYAEKTKTLQAYFSEFALMQYRVRVEVEYFIALCEMPLPQLKRFDKNLYNDLRDLYLDFDDAAARAIKDTERTTNHDVKAVEYYIKNQFERLGIEEFSEFVHFGLTSQDINNTAIPLSLKEAIDESFMPVIS